nr:integrase, catalytic region, zinc finger, CCHC-type, peptidase aspartic, catalytic [Tanacetum cinerariifolium]
MMSEDSRAAAHPQITNPVPTCSPAGIVMQPRDERDEEFTDAENLKELCDIQESNILCQGSGQILDRRKEDLFDEYERFRANGNELIQDYFVPFYKLINDMKVTKLTIPTHQINTKFENNLPRTREQSSSVVDPLAYLVKTTHQQAPTHSTTTSPSQLTPALASTSSSTAQSHDDAMSSSNTRTHATVHDGQITTELVQRRAPDNTRNTGYRGNQNNGQGVNNKKKVICYNCRGEGHVARQCKERKRPKDSLWHQDKAMLLQAKENGAVLDAEAEAFLADVECTVLLAEPLALTTTNMLQVNHEDAYDSDVDDEPNAVAAFMANLSSSSSQINKRYILVIVDDYTKFRWVRFLRTKDETPAVFERFLKNSQLALKAIVRTVKTDN